MFFAATKGKKEVHFLERVWVIIIAVFGVALGILGVVTAFVDIK